MSLAEKVLLVGRARADLLSNYVNLIEKGGIVAPMITYAYREHLYASLSDLYGAGQASVCPSWRPPACPGTRCNVSGARKGWRRRPPSAPVRSGGLAGDIGSGGAPLAPEG
jgi:hypothetical protein